MTFIVDGTNGLTFNNSTTQASAGVVLQVVNATYSTTFNTGSTTFVNSGLTASITPKFSTSKILVMVNMPTEVGSAAQTVFSTIYRNSTNIAPNTNLGVLRNGSNYIDSVLSMTILDSPATTSSTAYTVYVNVTAGNSYYHSAGGNESSVITLMEIAG
jgi:hypothetical protein